MSVWLSVPCLPEYVANADGQVMRVPYEEAMPHGGTRTYGGRPTFGVIREKNSFRPTIRFRRKNCGNLDDSLLDAIEDYVKRQRKRAEAPRLFSTDDDQPLARSSGDDLREDAKLSPSASNKGENVL
jgi:hypothetical protein